MYVDGLLLVFILALASIQLTSLATDWELWHKPSMPIFIEKFLLPILGAVVVAYILINPMKLNWVQRTSLAVAVGAFAFFLAYSLHLYNKASKNDEIIPTPAPTPIPTPTPTASPPPQIKTLYSLFEGNCKGTHALSTYTLISPGNSVAYEIRYGICADFTTRSFYLNFFLPKSDYTLPASQRLPVVYKELVKDILSGDMKNLFEGMIYHPPGEKEQKYSELAPSTVVYIYHETHLLESQVNELIAQYNKEHLYPYFRGPDYLIMRNSPLYESQNN